MNKIKISIVSPSIRPEGLYVVANAVSRQTFTAFEWLLGTPFFPKLDVDGITNFKWVEDDFKGGEWSLNRIYNKMIKEAKGEIVVSLQDWVWIPPDGLQKFVDAFEELGDKGVVSGVGDQYERMGDFKPEVKIWSDPRKNTNHGTFYEVYPNDIEFNYCAVPRKAFFDVGGFDEEMDFRCRGVDAIQVMERLDEMGYKSYIDQANESYTIRHGREDYGGEEEWNKTHGLFNGEHDKRKAELIKKGKWPVLSYLK